MKRWAILISLFLSLAFLSSTVFAAKPIMLAFRPDLTDIPNSFTYAIVPIYTTTDFNAIKNLLNNQLKNYVKVAAIDDMNQNNRIILVKNATSAGFNMIELDEQLFDPTLNKAQFARDLDSLKTYTTLPIAVTANHDPIIDFIDKGGKPDIVFSECNERTIFNNFKNYGLRELKNRLGTKPVYGVVNIADVAGETAWNQTFLKEVTRYLFYNGDGIWFWGKDTGNPTFEQKANENWPVVKSLITEFYNCSDTDGGLDYFTRGTILGGFEGKSYSYQDICTDRFNLKEYYCNGPYNASISYRCKTGTEDNDGGADSGIKGTCTVYDGCKNDGITNYGICKKSSYTDYCSSSSTLIEYYVSGSTCISTPINCGTDYICSGGRCTIPSTRCPILNAWDGQEFKEIEPLNIHAPKDTTYTSSFSMQPKNGKYEILLHEAAYKFWDGSHINSVKLTDYSGNECHLVSAVHSKQGDILQDLLYSDDKRVRTYPEEEVKLVYDSCSGTDFSFTIKGYNRKCGPYECGYFVFGYPMILIAPFISFVFVLLMVALYMLILSLLEKYKII